MATVEKQTRPVPVTTIEEREVVIILTLSSEEAQVLTDVYSSLGGDPDTSNRKYTSPVYEALREAGFRYRPGSKSGLWGEAMSFRTEQ